MFFILCKVQCSTSKPDEYRRSYESDSTAELDDTHVLDNKKRKSDYQQEQEEYVQQKRQKK